MPRTVRRGSYRSFAKINLHLQVIGPRRDGYHELRSLFQSIELHDLLELEPGPAGIRLEVTGGVAPEGGENLAYRAAESFLSRWGTPEMGITLRLRKEIPLGAGLGGGSSNAATVLRALRDLTGSPQRLEELWETGRWLGADVPYFLVEGTALGMGRGDEVVPLPDLESEPVIVAVPPVSVSTAEAFGRLRQETVASLAPSVLALAGSEPGRRPSELEAWNDFQESVLGWYPQVSRVYNALLDAGANVVRLSGTGSALFGFFDEPPSPEAIRREMPAGSSVYSTRTLSRKETERLRVAP